MSPGPSILKACPPHKTESDQGDHLSALKPPALKRQSGDTPVPRADERVLSLGHVLSLIGM